MNIRLFYGILAGLITLNFQSAQAQDVYQFGLLPSINLNKSLENDWSLNFKIESRQLLKAGIFGAEEINTYEYILTDFSFIAAKKVGLNSRIAGGYLIRNRQGTIINRFIQQFTVTQRLSSIRLSHRIVTDQTISPRVATEFRLRYRIAVEIPLNGQSADPKEFYLKLSNEYLNSLQNSDYDLEIRFIALPGYRINQNQRIEFGMDYRLNSFLDRGSRHAFWTSLNWFLEI